MITKLENGEVKLNDLTNDDQKVIMEILNQDGWETKRTSKGRKTSNR